MPSNKTAAEIIKQLRQAKKKFDQDIRRLESKQRDLFVKIIERLDREKMAAIKKGLQ